MHLDGYGVGRRGRDVVEAFDGGACMPPLRHAVATPGPASSVTSAAPSPRRGRQIRSISRKSPIERLHSRLRQETFFVCCTSICGSKRWKSKHVRRKRLARVCLKTGLGQPRQGAASASGARAATGWRQDRLAALSVGLCGVVWKMGEICLASRGTWPYNRK